MNYQNDDIERHRMVSDANKSETSPVHYDFQQPSSMQIQSPIHVQSMQMQVQQPMQMGQSQQIEYTLIRSKLLVENWSFYTKIIGWIFIVFTIFDMIRLFLCAIYGKYELPKGPDPYAPVSDRFNNYAVIDGSPFYFILLLRLIWIIIELLFGLKCLKTAENPTRRETWILVK